MHPLDNPSWHALTGLQKTFAIAGVALAIRFNPEVALHGAFHPSQADEPGLEAWDCLAALGTEPVTLFSPQPLDAPRSWAVIRLVNLLQMVQPPGSYPDPDLASRIEGLTSEDLGQMSALYEATRPGRKLVPRLIELGGFLGIRENRQLIAMACLRLNMNGYREISTVGTLPGHTGKGYATALVAELARRIRCEAKQAFLTVRTDNARAYGIYKRLGFRGRMQLWSTTIARCQE